MHAIQWEDPLSQVKRGLGFGIYPDEEIRVGHGGSCPGYRSVLSIDPTAGNAVAVMINASGTDPGRYANGIRNILEKQLFKLELLHINLRILKGFTTINPGLEKPILLPGDRVLPSCPYPAHRLALLPIVILKKTCFGAS